MLRSSSFLKPPFKWVGSKYRLIPTLTKMMPFHDTLVEPFLGSGVITLNSKAPNRIASDRSEVIVELQKLLQKDPLRVFERYKNLKEQYESSPSRVFYQVRTLFNEKKDPLLLLFLINHAYRGVYRTNKKGEFNVPHDKTKNKFKEITLDLFKRVSSHLQNVELSSQDYCNTISVASPGTFFFLDPPYATKGLYENSFDLGRFIRFLREIDRRGSLFLLTLDSKEVNSDTWLRTTKIETFNSLKNSKYHEYLFTNYDPNL